MIHRTCSNLVLRGLAILGITSYRMWPSVRVWKNPSCPLPYVTQRMTGDFPPSSGPIGTGPCLTLRASRLEEELHPEDENRPGQSSWIAVGVVNRLPLPVEPLLQLPPPARMALYWWVPARDGRELRETGA